MLWKDNRNEGSCASFFFSWVKGIVVDVTLDQCLSVCSDVIELDANKKYLDLANEFYSISPHPPYPPLLERDTVADYCN